MARVLEGDSCRQESVCPRAKLRTMACSAVRIDNIADGGGTLCQNYEVAGRADAVAAGSHWYVLLAATTVRHTNDV